MSTGATVEHHPHGCPPLGDVHPEESHVPS
jgi:hypothetical protein